MFSAPGLSEGAVLGIAIGVPVFVLLLIVIVFVCLYWRMRSQGRRRHRSGYKNGRWQYLRHCCTVSVFGFSELP